MDLGMPEQIRPKIESVLYLSIGCLDLAGHQVGQRCEARRAAKLLHQRGERTVGETIFRATIGPTTGIMKISHRSAHGGAFEQHLVLASIERHFGGRTWFFVCPVTGKHARKLHLWPQHGLFCHRLAACVPPTYASQRVGGVERIIRSIWAVRRKLDAEGGLLSSFEKPDWMPQRQFIAYARRYLMLAGRLDFTIEGFRLRK